MNRDNKEFRANTYRILLRVHFSQSEMKSSPAHGIPQTSFARAAELCDPYCIEIAAFQNGVLRHHGMGMLLAVGDHQFFVTCRQI